MFLKRVAVRVWNKAHQVWWRVLEITGALVHRRVERCAVCGRWSLMLYRRRVIPARLAEMWGLTPVLVEALARKESLDCARCGAKLRGRRLAEVLMEVLRPEPARRARSLREWAEGADAGSVTIAEVNPIDGVHDVLLPLPNVSCSSYVPGARPGEIRSGIRHEDLTGLTYGDGVFDVVLTSETLEHVPDLALALSEIRRVLKPGGVHLFTIPVLPGTKATYTRARLGPDGSIEVIAPPLLHHPGGDVGYPVFTEFGCDVPELMSAAGFQFEVRFGPTREIDLGQVYVAKKLDA